MPNDLEIAVDEYLSEWMASMPPAGATIEWHKARLHEPHAMLNVSFGPTNMVSIACYRALERAAELLLAQMGEQRRVTAATALRALLEAHRDHLPKVLKTKIFSEYAIIARAKKLVQASPRVGGHFILPLVFSGLTPDTEFHLGPTSLLSAKNFNGQYGSAIEKAATKDEWHEKAALDWKNYSESYDHFVIVDVHGHERDKAWTCAREAAELILNLIRIAFGFGLTGDIRLGDGFVWERRRASVYFDKSKNANFSLSSGPWGSIIESGWEDRLAYLLNGNEAIVGALAHWMVSGINSASPVLERLRYANALIAEAYSEPHDHIRLVRLISALEALALLPREEKAHHLGLHCAWAVGWADTGLALQVYEKIRAAYLVRNEIVHGDGPPARRIQTAFHGVERNLGRIWLGFLHLYSTIQREESPRHIRKLRQSFARRIEMSFWMTETL